MSSVTTSIFIDRDSGTFDLSISYSIDPYIDPETGEYFGDTSWAVTDGFGGTGGWASDSETVTVNYGLAGGEDLVSSTLSFSAQNTFSGVSVSEEWNLLVAAYATGDLTADGSAGQDIIITGAGNDTASGNDGNDILNTGDGDDTLDGGEGADQFDGGRGDDTMIGGDGDDFYTVDSAADEAVEEAGGGNDVVMSSVSYTLADEVEQLILNGPGPLDGTGNAGNNQLYGNQDVNVLDGLDGNDVLGGYDGDDTLRGGDGNDTLDGGLGDDTMEGGADDDTYTVDSSGDVVVEVAGGGVDTVRVSGLASYTLSDEVENLTQVWVSDFQGTGNDHANVLTGGAGNDTLLGLGGDDVLQGGNGNDTLEGGAGADQHVGGSGLDTADYADASAGISLDLASGGTGGDAAGDTFSSIERVVGSDFADVIVGDALDNELVGGAGNDWLQGDAGSDVLIGGAGADVLLGGDDGDWVSYAGSTGAVFVDLTSHLIGGGDATGDIAIGFINVAGGDGNDILAGNSGANRLFGDAGADFIWGRAGDDTIEGGAGGDVLLGGAGFDLLSYASSAHGVTLDLGSETASGGDAAGDRYAGFEGAIGSAFGDDITGSSGNDTIEGGGGADLLDGGDGVDTLSYAGLSGWASVSLLSGTTYELSGATDTFANFENVVGSAFGDAIYGDNAANAIDGGAGSDFIIGFGGDDQLTGGDGDDFFYIDLSSGSDTVLDFQAGGFEDSIGVGLGFDFDSFSEVMAVASQAGADTVLNFAPDLRLTLIGVNVAALTETDFSFN